RRGRPGTLPRACPARSSRCGPRDGGGRSRRPACGPRRGRGTPPAEPRGPPAPRAWPRRCRRARRSAHGPPRPPLDPARARSRGPGLAESEHDRGLREEIIPHTLRVAEDLQTLCIIRAAVTNGSLETLDGLDVVIEDIHTGIDDGSHGLEVSLEVRDERFDEQL